MSSRRAELLAVRIEEGAHELETFAQGLSDAQWRTVVPPDGRQVGVIIHHVASVYPIEIDLAKTIASGKVVTDVTWEVVAEMNAAHARDQGAVTRRSRISTGEQACSSRRTGTTSNDNVESIR